MMATSGDEQSLGTPRGQFVVGDGIPPKDPAVRNVLDEVSLADLVRGRLPAVAGFVGKRRAVHGAAPDPDGNRAARRAWQKLNRDPGPRQATGKDRADMEWTRRQLGESRDV
jgi:hypothetical protein